MSAETEIKTANALTSQAEAAQAMSQMMEMIAGADQIKAEQRDKVALLCACLAARKQATSTATSTITYDDIVRDTLYLYRELAPHVGLG